MIVEYDTLLTIDAHDTSVSVPELAEFTFSSQILSIHLPDF